MDAAEYCHARNTAESILSRGVWIIMLIAVYEWDQMKTV
jgi:hypothetical protein